MAHAAVAGASSSVVSGLVGAGSLKVLYIVCASVVDASRVNATRNILVGEDLVADAPYETEKGGVQFNCRG
jgi:hypothetical protein